jgi:hypothetical protein
VSEGQESRMARLEEKLDRVLDAVVEQREVTKQVQINTCEVMQVQARLEERVSSLERFRAWVVAPLFLGPLGFFVKKSIE